MLNTRTVLESHSHCRQSFSTQVIGHRESIPELFRDVISRIATSVFSVIRNVVDSLNKFVVRQNSVFISNLGGGVSARIPLNGEYSNLTYFLFSPKSIEK